MNIVQIMEDWQSGKDNEKLVHVRSFQLMPQSVGFMLHVEFYIADKHNPESSLPNKNFFGTLDSCFTGALSYIEEEKYRLKSLL